MFISILELNIEPTDDSTYFSIIPIDAMNRLEEPMRFDKNTIIEYKKWIQVRFFDRYFTLKFSSPIILFISYEIIFYMI